VPLSNTYLPLSTSLDYPPAIPFVILSAAKDLILTIPVVSMRSFAALRMTNGMAGG
jgi:hypothetical protein